jgi:hypothetical protein
MPLMLADFKDLNDSMGRSYREVNHEKKHRIKIGTLVELEDGVRLWVVAHMRDCDQTPLYELSADKNDLIQYDPRFRNLSWVGGYPEDSLKKIRRKVVGGGIE